MDTILKQVVDVVLNLAGTVLATLVCVGTSYLISWLKSKCKSDKADQAWSDIEVAVTEGIYFTEQTLVKQLKESDKWDADAQKNVLEQCVSYVLEHLTDTASKYLPENEAELRKVITEKIESKLGELHS